MTGRRLVKAACQPAETYQRAETERRCRSVYSLLDYCTIVAVSATDGRSIDTLAIYHTNRLSRYRYLQDGAVWHVQPITLDMDPMRGHCNGTRYVERRATDRSVSRQSLACSRQTECAVHSADTAVAYVFTHRCTWRRRDAEVRKTFVFL